MRPLKTREMDKWRKDGFNFVVYISRGYAALPFLVMFLKGIITVLGIYLQILMRDTSIIESPFQ